MKSHAGHGPALGIQVIINTRIIRVRGPHTESIMKVTMGGRELKHLLKCSLKMMDHTPEDYMDQLQAQMEVVEHTGVGVETDREVEREERERRNQKAERD